MEQNGLWRRCAGRALWNFGTGKPRLNVATAILRAVHTEASKHKSATHSAGCEMEFSCECRLRLLAPRIHSARKSGTVEAVW